MDSVRLQKLRRFRPSKKARRMGTLSGKRWAQALGSSGDGNAGSNAGGSTNLPGPGPSGMSRDGRGTAQPEPQGSSSDSERDEMPKVSSPAPSGMSHDDSSGPGQLGPREGTSGDETSRTGSGSEFCPTPVKKLCVRPVDLGKKLFVCQTSQFQSFIDQMNATSVCATPRCIGKLVPVSIGCLDREGLL